MSKVSEALPARSAGSVIRKRWRAWLRAFHRDIGYLIVGLTFIYAISGLAINHVGDFDPNFKIVKQTHQIETPIPAGDEEQATDYVVSQLGIDAEPRDFFFEGDTQLEIYFDRRNLIVDMQTGAVVDRAEKPRVFLRVANWLHYNRGKAAWTYIADGYALLLLFLATSGIFMLKGRKGFLGRGVVFIAAGALVPIVYVTLSGGPGG